MFKRIPGTKDILPDQIFQWQDLEAGARRIFTLYNYREIRPPLIEDASLFNRSLGTTTDIVQKQMFLIPHQEDTYALRPEGTASVVRAYIENSLDKQTGLAKLFYMGPMFRLERPQKGRLRQFHHIGAEVIGTGEPALDVEVIALADQLLKAFSIDGYTIKINSLGCATDKLTLSALLHDRLNTRVSDLCQDCQTRFENNILRVLDCKNPACKDIVNNLNIGNAYLCPDCKTHFDAVVSGLDSLNISYTILPQLVRGLDYYTRTVFEISHSSLGAQDAIGAGGRYDNLVKELGGPDLGAIGFALGSERVVLAKTDAQPQINNNTVFLAAMGDEARKACIKILQNLRQRGIRCDIDYQGRSLKGAMRLANDQGARFVAIIGENEIKNNTIALKDMKSGQQDEIKSEELTNELNRRLESQ